MWQHGESELLKAFLSNIPDGRHGLKFFRWHLLPNSVEWAETWWEASDTELQNCYNSSIPISKIATMVASWNSSNASTSPKPQVRLSQNLIGGITISELLKSFFSDIQGGRQSSHLEILNNLQNHKSDSAETWWEASGLHRDSELLKSFCSDIQDDRHGSHLENSSNDISQTVSQIEPKLDGRHSSDIEIQNC